MKIQEVILRAVAKKITWTEAGKIIGLCERQMRRWKQHYQEFGYDGLCDRRLGKPNPERVPLATVEEVLGLYQEKYADLTTFSGKLREKHHIRLSYTWVKHALQMAGLVKKSRKRGVHRRRRARRRFRGCCCIWMAVRTPGFKMTGGMTCLVLLDDATCEIYYTQLVEEESTATMMTALREVIERRGAFCALYSDRASHFFHTESRSAGGSQATDTGGAGAGGVGDPDDSGLLATGSRSRRPELCTRTAPSFPTDASTKCVAMPRPEAASILNSLSAQQAREPLASGADSPAACA
jgi:transposase